MKKYTILFWVSTAIIFIMEGVLVALTWHTDMAIQGITSLGYPAYFAAMLAAFKVLGSLALIIPKVPARVKEWAYAGFGIDFICALASSWVVMGFGAPLLLPAAFIVILVVSYVSYHRVSAPELA